MPAIGDPIPDLVLPRIDGPACRLAELPPQIVAIDFWSAECPWSKTYDRWLSDQYAPWRKSGIAFLAVATNADEDDPRVREAIATRDLRFPVFCDPAHRLADALGATHTPHVFIYDQAGRLAYQGALDDRTFRRRTATVNYLSRALEALLAGNSPEPAMTQPYGCTIVRLPETRR